MITNIRNRRVDHYLHTASKRIVDFLVQEGVGTIIIGKNPLWKQEVNNGRHNNQNFVCIPHARLIEMLTYSAIRSLQTVAIRGTSGKEIFDNYLSDVG